MDIPPTVSNLKKGDDGKLEIPTTISKSLTELTNERDGLETKIANQQKLISSLQKELTLVEAYLAEAVKLGVQ